MSERRLITTLDQLAATPDLTVIFDAAGDALQKLDGRWYFGGDEEGVILPARVLLESWER